MKEWGIKACLDREREREVGEVDGGPGRRQPTT